MVSAGIATKIGASLVLRRAPLMIAFRLARTGTPLFYIVM
jgi:hypothetical protein